MSRRLFAALSSVLSPLIALALMFFAQMAHAQASERAQQVGSAEQSEKVQLPKWGFANTSLENEGQNPPVQLKGAFSQQKQTRFMRRPIRSSGTLLVSAAPGKGIIWHTEMPVASTLVISEKSITTLDSEGTRQQLGGASGLNLVFLNALTGNWQVLAEHFTLTLEPPSEQAGQATAPSWPICVNLIPKTDMTKTALESITICGSETEITQMRIVEPGGAQSDIRFELAPYPALNEQEQNLFKP